MKNPYLFLYYLMHKVKLVVCLLFVVLINSQTKISGKIVDAKTNKPLTSVEIFINGKEKAALTSNNSEFLIESDSGISTATFIKANYKPEILNFTNLRFENLLVKLQTEKVEQISEVVISGVTRKKYKNKKENPA